jgi:hypothetical protein
LLLVAVGSAAFLMTRLSAGRTEAAGTEHGLGAVAAPVVVEEWSDFE